MSLLKDRDLTPPAQAPAPNWSQASTHCYLCSLDTGFTCELCAKAVCELHAIPHTASGQRMCCTCDENVLKEVIRAEMQEELVALGRELETEKAKLEEIETQEREIDREITQLKADSAQISADEKALETEILAEIHAEEAYFHQLQLDISTLQAAHQDLEAEDQKLTEAYIQTDQELSQITAERHNLHIRRKEMAASLERVNKQLQDTFPPGQLESIACDQCKRKLAASYHAREPSRH